MRIQSDIHPYSLYPCPAVDAMPTAVRSVLRSLAPALVGALLLAWPAGAQTTEQAQAAYDHGRFAEAAALAEKLHTSEGYTLAAQALATHGYFAAANGKKEALFERAIQLARQAIRLDPANPEAHIQSAHAMGRYAQAVGFLKAVAGGYARKVRQAIDKALRLAPDMAGAHLSMATWHAKLANGAGPMAGLLYGATARKARRHYRRTIELAPDGKVALIEYASALLVMDKKRHRAEALRLLKRAVAKPPKDAVDRIYHKRALARLATLTVRPAARDSAAASAMARAASPSRPSGNATSPPRTTAQNAAISWR